MAKCAGIGALIGLIVGIGMTVEGETAWSVLLGPVTFAAASAATFGTLFALLWWIFPGRVTYDVSDGFLTARRGSWVRKQIPVDRIAEIEFDEDIEQATWS